MKSSSDLFPVTLLTAELKPQWNEDTYLLKPNNSGDPTVSFALTRFSVDPTKKGKPILWLPPFLHGRGEWLAYAEPWVKTLLNAGYDLWFLEWRGHGASVFNEQWSSNRLHLLAWCDVPAALDFIVEQSDSPVKMVAESSAAQVWVKAMAYEKTLPIVGSLLWYPALGRLSCAAYVTRMNWESHALESTRGGVKHRTGHESLNRHLFDELMLGQRALLGRWQSGGFPGRLRVIEDPALEKPLTKWMSSLGDAEYQTKADYYPPGKVSPALWANWLDELDP